MHASINADTNPFHIDSLLIKNFKSMFWENAAKRHEVNEHDP